jgi:hypothetical protein
MMKKSVPGTSLHFGEKNLFGFLPSPRFHIQKAQIENSLSIFRVETESLQKMDLRFFHFSLNHQEESKLILEICIIGMNLNLSSDLI